MQTTCYTHAHGAPPVASDLDVIEHATHVP
ncbi:MAG: hypothetical protein JWM82_1432 [Myxococcales bacterium]|jgi:hypothetical protein|nr:hypothetical protein [Myxococcales bacterium]